MKMNKKLIVATAACAALLIGSISTSLAWLKAEASPVTNTFTSSTIGVNIKEGESLTETSGSYKMVPGWTITKDPMAWVTEGSEDAILFVKVEESSNFDYFMTYQLADGWTVLSSTSDGNNTNSGDENNTYVIYRTVDTSKMGQANAFQILKDDAVTVKGEVTKEDMSGSFSQPTLKFTAYAHQLYKNEDNEAFEAQDAWDNINS